MTIAIAQVGIDHELAPLEVREDLALDRVAVTSLARRIHALPWADETFVLTTCNRTEIYVATAAPNAPARILSEVLDHLPSAPKRDAACYRQQSGDAAAAWLLRVASGLESAVLGETEIQGQVREALVRAQEDETVGPVLERLLQSALRTGKRVRSETELGIGGVSHGHAAVDVMRGLFDDMQGRSVLLIGAGAIAEQAARALSTLPGARFLVANRSPERAEGLAAALGGSTVGFDQIVTALEDVHVALFATGTQVVAHDALLRAASRRREPVLLIDLGMPRSVDPRAAELPGVFLYDLEHLERVVGQALEERARAIPSAEIVVREEFARFHTWYRTLAALPTLRRLNAWAEAIRAEEVEYVRGTLHPSDEEAVERLTQRIVRRLLGRAAARVVKGTEGDDPDLPTAETLRHVFGLEDGEPS